MLICNAEDEPLYLDGPVCRVPLVEREEDLHWSTKGTEAQRQLSGMLHVGLLLLL
jgi:hypothetical protein